MDLLFYNWPHFSFLFFCRCYFLPSVCQSYHMLCKHWRWLNMPSTAALLYTLECVKVLPMLEFFFFFTPTFSIYGSLALTQHTIRTRRVRITTWTAFHKKNKSGSRTNNRKTRGKCCRESGESWQWEERIGDILARDVREESVNNLACIFVVRTAWARGRSQNPQCLAWKGLSLERLEHSILGTAALERNTHQSPGNTHSQRPCQV